MRVMKRIKAKEEHSFPFPLCDDIEKSHYAILDFGYLNEIGPIYSRWIKPALIMPISGGYVQFTQFPLKKHTFFVLHSYRMQTDRI